MNAAEILTYLLRQGAVVRIREDERLGVKAPTGVVTPEVRAAMVRHKPRLLRLLDFAEEYRELLRDMFDARAAGIVLADKERQQFLDEQARLTDELGPELTGELARSTARAWTRETSECPWCDGACNAWSHPA